jgi:gas vesicle protein
MVKAIRFLTGLTLGMLAGAVAGIMLAPESGDQLRRMLSDRFRAILDEGRQAAAERRAELQQQFAEAKRLRPLPPDGT